MPNPEYPMQRNDPEGQRLVAEDRLSEQLAVEELAGELSGTAFLSEPLQVVGPHVPDVVADDAVTPGRLTRLRHALGLDRAVVFTVLARGWSSLAGIVTLALIARFLSRAEQGYYYTFYSLVALQMIFELGFSVVILQTASHEAAHLQFHDHGRIEGPVAAHSRLASVLQKSVRWYTIGALVMVAILLPVGIRFFSSTPVATPPVHWLGAWCLVVVASGFTFQIDPTFSFLEGCGFVSSVARARLMQAMAGTLLGWAALALHHGLYAPGLLISSQAIVGILYLMRRRNLLGPLLRRVQTEFAIDWGTEVWPFQWRIAVSWVCGYFITQLFTPVLFHYRGAGGVIEAGQMGMTVNICGTLTSVAIAWMNTKAAPFGRLIALREFAALDRMFFRALRQSLGAALLASVAVWVAVALLRARGIPLALRILPLAPLALLLVTSMCNILVFAEALYLRAHKQEKFMMNSILGALWMVPAALLLGRWYGAYGIAVGYFLGTLFIGVGLGTTTFAKYRRVWHA